MADTIDATMRTTPIRAFVVGSCRHLTTMLQDLTASGAISIVGSSSDPAGAGSMLATTSPQVILDARDGDAGSIAADVSTIREHSDAPIVLLTTSSGPAVIGQAIASGVADVALLPQPAAALAFTIRKAQAVGTIAATSMPMAASRGTQSSRVITVFGAKGGSGRTAIAVNVATTCERTLGKRTLVIDLDLQFGDVGLALGIDPRMTILDLVLAHGELDADKLAGFVTRSDSGVDVLPAPLRPEDAELVTEERLSTLIAAARQRYDVVVIDTPAGFSPTVLTALDRTDDLLLVTTPDVAAIKNTRACLQTLLMLQFPHDRCHIVLNNPDGRSTLGRDDVEHALERKVTLEMPNSKGISSSLDAGIPLVIGDRRGDMAQAISRLCMRVLPDATAIPERRSPGRRRMHVPLPSLAPALMSGRRERQVA